MTTVLASEAEYEDNVHCIVMPCCGFTFDSSYVDDKVEPPQYTCPNCTIKPRRKDDVDLWLKRMRDGKYARSDFGYVVVNRLLDRYRECADYRLTLKPQDDQRGDP